MTGHSVSRQVILLLPLFLIQTSLATFNYPYNYYHCDDPGVPDDGYRNGDDFNVGVTLQFSCNSGFVLYGSKTITCEQGNYEAYWTDDAPTCIRELITLYHRY